MGLIRLILLFLVAWWAVRLLRRLVAPAPRRDGPAWGEARPRAPHSQRPRPLGGELVQDPRCGVYVPKETAVRGAGGAYFCSEECRRLHESAEP